jgi:hypothetical protein
VRRCRFFHKGVNMPGVEKPISQDRGEPPKSPGLTASGLGVPPPVACAAPKALSLDDLRGPHPLTIPSPQAGMIDRSERAPRIALTSSEEEDHV